MHRRENQEIHQPVIFTAVLPIAASKSINGSNAEWQSKTFRAKMFFEAIFRLFNWMDVDVLR